MPAAVVKDGTVMPKFRQGKFSPLFLTAKFSPRNSPLANPPPPCTRIIQLTQPFLTCNIQHPVRTAVSCRLSHKHNLANIH